MITTKKTREEMRRWQNFRGQKKDAKCLEAEKNNKKKTSQFLLQNSRNKVYQLSSRNS